MTRAKLKPSTLYAAKLTGEQAIAVRRDRANEKTVSDVARGLGVSRSSVKAIVDGRTRREV